MGTISTMLWCGIAFWRGASHFLHGVYWWFGGFDGSGDGRSESWWIVELIVRENRDGWWWWRRMKVSVWKRKLESEGFVECRRWVEAESEDEKKRVAAD